MSYLDQVLSRLSLPGVLLLAAGAVLGYASSPLAGMIRPQNKDTVSIILKAAGCALALAGALVLLDFFG